MKITEPETELTSLIGWSVFGGLTAGGLPESEADSGTTYYKRILQEMNTFIPTGKDIPGARYC